MRVTGGGAAAGAGAASLAGLAARARPGPLIAAKLAPAEPRRIVRRSRAGIFLLPWFMCFIADAVLAFRSAGSVLLSSSTFSPALPNGNGNLARSSIFAKPAGLTARKLMAEYTLGSIL